MEQVLEDMSTRDILDRIHGTVETGYTSVELWTELLDEDRWIATDDTNVPSEYRGGIRPHKPHI